MNLGQAQLTKALHGPPLYYTSRRDITDVAGFYGSFATASSATAQQGKTGPQQGCLRAYLRTAASICKQDVAWM